MFSMFGRISKWVIGILFASLPNYAFSPGNLEELISVEGEKTLQLYYELAIEELPFSVFTMAYSGFREINYHHSKANDSILTIIDFSRPSTEMRLYIFDLKNRQVLHKSLVSHGMGSGNLYARTFSNTPQSHKSSLGFYLTDDTYIGKHGYSLRLRGLEKGINDNAWKRAIVIHGAHYVSAEYIESYGRLGRSFGCPALPYDSSREVINLIRNNTCLFIYYPDENYFHASGFASLLNS